MIESYLANKNREWRINLDSFNPCEASREHRLFSRLQYILNVVFYVKIYVSTQHGMENLCIFIEDMPDKFEKEKLDINFERVSMQSSL